jgi:photosystem II stability/assembly factor-like uncharacterized protein
MMTADYGANWVNTEPILDRGQIWSFCFVGDTTQMWMVGDDGAILSTSSGLGGIQESPKPQATSSKLGPTIVRGVLVLGAVGSRQNTAGRTELLDISGRKVLALRAGTNDVSRLAPGVYFVRSSSVKSHSSIAKVVVTK